MWVCVHECSYPQKTEEGIRLSGAGVIGLLSVHCELNFCSVKEQCALKYWALSSGTSIITFSHVSTRKYQYDNTCYRCIHVILFDQTSHQFFSEQVCTTSGSITQNSQPPQMSYFLFLMLWLQSSDKSYLREKGLIRADASLRCHPLGQGNHKVRKLEEGGHVTSTEKWRALHRYMLR